MINYLVVCTNKQCPCVCVCVCMCVCACVCVCVCDDSCAAFPPQSVLFGDFSETEVEDLFSGGTRDLEVYQTVVCHHR